MKSSSYNHDLLVIGSGPAGQEGAITAANLRKKAAIVERKWSPAAPSLFSWTVPSKILREAVLSLKALRAVQPGDLALNRIDMSDLTSRVEAVVRNERAVIKSKLERSNVESIEGEARLIDAHTVEIQTGAGATRVTAENLLIAVGTRPAAPAHVSIDGKRIYNSDHLLSLQQLPRDLIIVGSGLIGIEYASMLVLLGVKITLVDERPALLDFVDREIVNNLKSQLTQLGVTFRLGQVIRSCKANSSGDGVTVTLENGESIVGESLLYVAGQDANTDKLNLASVDVCTTENGKVEVNEHFQTAVANIYAAGDVIGFPAEGLYYGSVSMMQGRLAIFNMYGYPATSRPELFAYGLYAIPEMSMVGQTEEQLKERQVEYRTGIAYYRDLANAQIVGDENGFLKLLFDPDSLKLLGVHIIGERAAEIIHIGQAVLSFGGTIEYFRDAVFTYPSMAEAYKLAALDGMHKVGLLP
jgi:NAD(P) transhydrogenase